MKPDTAPKGSNPTFSEMVTKEEVPVPAGTLVPDKTRSLEGHPLVGVSKISNTVLREGEIRAYFPREDWDKISEGTPTTSVFLEGMRGKRMVVVEKRDLTAEEINEIIKLCVQIDLLYQHHEFSEKVYKAAKDLVKDTSFPLDNYINTIKANPKIFPEEQNSDNDPVRLIEKQLAELGIMFESMKQGIPNSMKKINEIIKRFDDMKVLVFQNVGAMTGQMWWPIKRFIKTPYNEVEKGSGLR